MKIIYVIIIIMVLFSYPLLVYRAYQEGFQDGINHTCPFTPPPHSILSLLEAPNG